MHPIAVPGVDPVNAPPHYAASARVECIEVIEDLELGYHLGNAMKYIWRTGRKDPSKALEDLRKARWYLDREIQRRTDQVDA